jgi:hypothetical protein
VIYILKVKIAISSFSGRPKHNILDGVLDLLLSHGNELATDYRWGSNPTGYFTLLKRQVDFDLVRRHFDLPASIILDERFGEIDYGMGTVVIRTVGGCSSFCVRLIS